MLIRRWSQVNAVPDADADAAANDVYGDNDNDHHDNRGIIYKRILYFIFYSIL